MLYTKTSLQATLVNLQTNCGNRSFQDSVWCEIRLRGTDKLLVGCIYRSPNSSAENNALLAEHLSLASNRGNSHVIVMGDFNHPEIDWTKIQTTVGINHPATIFLESIRDAFLHQHVSEPTHHRATQTANILDLIFSNEPDMIENLQNLVPIGKSHHSVLSFNILCYVEKKLQDERFINMIKEITRK